MKSFEMHSALRLTVLASALLAVFGSVQAEEVDEVTRLSRPESTVQFGLGYVTDDNRRYGQYLGLPDSGFVGILNADIARRDDATGTLFRARARNLGLDSRELRLDHARQGQWGYFFDYTEIPRHQQYVINSGLQGIGTDSLSVAANNPANRRDVTLKVKREKATLGYARNLGGGFDAQVRFSHEEKDGTRLFGQGNAPFSSAGAFYLLAEPLDSTTQILDASVGYTGDQYQLQGGYYASVFDNHVNGLRVAYDPSLTADLQPLALPPGNESQQVFLAGAYEFSRTTKGNFKASYGKTTQRDAFITLPAGQSSLSTRTDLGGEVDTTLLNVGLSSRPLPKLSLAANLRYEDRDDQTPVVSYNATTPYDTRSFRVTSGKLDAGYQLASGLRGIAAVEHEIKERNLVPNRVANQREETEETTLRLELRRTLSETLNGGLALIHSDRDGSDFVYTGTATTGHVAPLHLADRKRDKVRLSADWAATEAFSMQFMVEEAQDEYASVDKEVVPGSAKGVREGRGQLYSVDASYALGLDWQFNAWAQHSRSTVDQAGGTGAAANVFTSGLADESDTAGIGLKGRLLRKVDVGVDLQHARNVSEFGLVNGAGADISLPDIRYETTTLRLYGRYPLQVNAGVQLDFVHDRRVIDDWTWPSANTSALFDDGTTVRQDSVQTTNFIGVSGYYKWW